MCGMRVDSMISSVTRMRMGNAPCRMGVRGPTGGRVIALGHPTRTPAATDNRPIVSHPTTSAAGNTIGSPLPNMVLRIGYGINSAIGENRGLLILRTVGVRGGVGTSHSNGVVRVGMGGKSSMLRNTSLIMVKWCCIEVDVVANDECNS